jgi:hypothetical protein
MLKNPCLGTFSLSFVHFVFSATFPTCFCTFSPDGHLFCKGCIYEDLLSQKAQIKARTEQWERQQEEDRNTAASKAEAAEQQKVANFFNKEMSVLPTTASAGLFAIFLSYSTMFI